MEKQILSKTEVSELLGISISTLDRRIREGMLEPINEFGHPKFNINDVLEIAGTKTGKLSPFERRRLEQENARLKRDIEELKEENLKIKNQITNALVDLVPILKEAEVNV